ncbi:hepcidin-like isoform X1 [Melanotaenia boesemani]|uniref:hepcidin-like isoform X1 n=1 Tax=Melanotaenia boesemani TaxID=1250792 RepID=UPI001C03AA2C|nr:hepcidin-like isoform X1 [Melanotaenia boesemani]
MKLFSIAVAVAIMLTSICLQENSAAPVNEGQYMEEPVISDIQSAAHEETSVDSGKMLVDGRQKRGTCGLCCTNGHCTRCCYA